MRKITLSQKSIFFVIQTLTVKWRSHLKVSLFVLNSVKLCFVLPVVQLKKNVKKLLRNVEYCKSQKKGKKLQY